MSRIANSNVAGYMQGVGQALTDDTTYHISSSATTVLGATAEVAEAITLFLPMIGLVAELTAKIIEAYNNAQINKRSCTALVNRVQAAEVAVQALVRNRYDNEEKFKDKNYYHCFQRFVNLLKDIKKFIVDVTQMSGLKKFFQSGSIKSKFERYIKDFDSTVNDLNLAVVIASEEQRQKDFKVISDSFETIMKFLENVAGNVAVVKTHNNEKIIEMNTNFSIVPQLKHQVDQLTKQLSEGTDAQSKPKPKPKFIQPNELKNARHYTNCTQDNKWLPKITNFEYSRGLDAYTIDLENSVLTMVHWFPPEKMLHYQLNQDVWKPDPDSRPDIVDLFNSLYDLLDKVKPDCSPLFSPIKNDEAIKASISINNNNKANNIVNGGNDDGDDPSLLPNFVDFSLDDEYDITLLSIYFL
ncbi:8405_t:CDS:2 [Entrophospora sp. SA101]|nr:8405_t:CDS:2 [Entrophospora sp. SA101]